MLKSTSPYSNETFNTFQLLKHSAIEAKLATSFSVFQSYRLSSYDQRVNWLNNAAEILEKNKHRYAVSITREMGKLIGESVAEVEKCAWVCRYYAENGPKLLHDQMIKTDATKSYVCYQPIGPVLAVMPWNFPFWQVFRFAAPALMVGNTGLLKHASNVPQCALDIEEIFREAGFPEGAFQTLLISSDQVNPVIADSRVRAVTLTGSEPAGAAVASVAGQHLKKSVLELGGSDPYILLEDANVEKAVDICIKGRMLNAGQSCIAAKRFIVHERLYSDFLDLFELGLKDYHFGDPQDKATTLAPLASKRHRQELHEQVINAQHKGAKVICGGYLPNDISGAFYPPTILTEVDSMNPAYREELFGPVAICLSANSEKLAIKIANDTSFGLGAAIFSQDIKRAEHLAKTKLEAGSCFVNAQVKSDPRLPFGGIKHSGYGRELSLHGIQEFTNIKTVYVSQE